MKPKGSQNSAAGNIFGSVWTLAKSLVMDAGRIDWTEERLQSAPPARLRLHLFLTSFLILFFELACIRWVPAHVRYLSYFMNFVLLAIFLGSGIGILLGRRARLWLPPFPLVWFLLVYLVAKNNFVLKISSTQVLYYGASEGAAQAENFLILPVIFGLVVIAVLPLGRSLGRLLTGLPPLQAYAIDILGSLAGIAAFFVMSYFSFQPLVWFGLAALFYVFLRPPKDLILSLPLLVGSLYVVYWLSVGSQWSPYYRIQTYPNQDGGISISVNNTGHQAMSPLDKKENFYFRVYDLFAPRRFEKVLILGAGSGSDVAIALGEGAQQVDAVEIDPVIYQLGVRLNPVRPYDDPRVHMFIDDGRATLRNSDQRYDLIIFALPDSLTLTSGFSSLRLESFLLTVESIEAARSLLAEDGVVVLYNYYREDWLIEKLAYMLQTAFGEPPHVTTYGDWGKAAVMIAGHNLAQLNPRLDQPFTHDISGEKPSRGVPLPILGTGRLQVTTHQELAQDDWPFVYMQHRTIPTVFLAAFGMVLLVTAACLAFAWPRAASARRLRFEWHFFFLGVAFMLLETRSLVTFSLLFGTTWMVNSLVFFAILSSVLLAIFVNYKYRIRNPRWLYLLLVGSIVLNYLLPLRALLALENPALRYALAGLLAFVPIFLANVVFSHSFRDTETADMAFGSNLIGAVLGGMLEYAALALGYQALLLVALTAYLLAFISGRRQPFKE